MHLTWAYSVPAIRGSSHDACTFLKSLTAVPQEGTLYGVHAISAAENLQLCLELRPCLSQCKTCTMSGNLLHALLWLLHASCTASLSGTSLTTNCLLNCGCPLQAFDYPTVGEIAAHIIHLLSTTATETAAAANLHSEVHTALTAATTAATAAALTAASAPVTATELSTLAAVAELPSEGGRAHMLQLVTAAAAEALESSGSAAGSPPLQEPLMDAGLSSAGAVQLVALLEAATGLELPGTLVFDYPTIAEMTDHLLSMQPATNTLPSPGNITPLPQVALTPSSAATVGGPQTAPPATAAAAVAQSDIFTAVLAALADVLGLTTAEAEELSLNSPLMEAGLTSASAVQLTGALEEALDTDLPATLTFDYPTIASLVSHLATLKPPSGTPSVQPAASGSSRAIASAAPVDYSAAEAIATPTAQVSRQVAPTTASGPSRAIAIVGSAHRVPGGVLQPRAFTPPVDRVSSVPLDRWDSNQAAPDSASELNAAFGAFLQGADEFDPAAFHLSAAEATLMDPQQRLLLETFAEAQSALTHWVNASDRNTNQYASSSGVKQRFGVYVGVSQLEYARITYETGFNLNAYYATGAHLSVTSGRIAYTFGLKGPAMAGIYFIFPSVVLVTFLLLCCAMVCSAVLCCAVLCCAVPCNTMLCCITPC